LCHISVAPKLLTNGGLGNGDDDNIKQMLLTSSEDPNDSSSSGPNGGELDPLKGYVGK